MSLPQIPNRFDFAEAQPRIYQRWLDRRCFHAEPNADFPSFTIVIPPPNVTGALHLGHALNNSLQDTLVRLRRMQGFEALWMPGTDHAGIATQAVVERRLKEQAGLTRHDLGREELVRRIWAWKDQYEARIIEQLQRMGCSCDWDRLRFTLDDQCARAVRRTFFDLFRQQLIYRGKRLVNWDTYLQTAVSDDEVFHETIQGHFWHFRYPVIDPQPGEPTAVTIATTRPETMLGDTAVAVHPDPAAALDQVQRELEEKLADAPAREKPAIQRQLDVIAARRREVLPTLEKLRDMAADGRNLMLPLLDREIALVADEWAKPELGSGCVKITPAHDPNDYEVGLRQNLPMINILNPDGTLNENAGPYQGLTIAAARQRVVADLEAQGLVEQIEDREIELAHSDRSKTPIEPYLADQYFIKMESLAQSAMDAVTDGRVKIIPTRYAKGYLDWLSEKRDWPVSRQLWWGHQIPIWSREMKSREEFEAFERKWATWSPDREQAAWQLELNEERAAADQAETIRGASKVKLPYGIVHVCLDEDDSDLLEQLDAEGFVREEDVLDTWFSSALWPHSTLGWPKKTPELDYFYPTSTLITSRDIITLWVARMVLAGLNNVRDVPFREVFIHPKILDGYGETMSKSKGNGVDPVDVIEKYGADALRYGLVSLTTETQDVRMPVQFECPHCGHLIDQTKKNREQPRVECPECGKSFRTQWASTPEDLELLRGAATSERFETARNFCNKLWNASRLVLLNLDGYAPGPVTDNDLAVEDRWILSRLASVTGDVSEALDGYRYADAARSIYDFTWREFCDFYLEMNKTRLADAASRPAAQRMLAHVLDALLRLLHPMIPFVTEEIWGLLGDRAPERGLPEPSPANELLIRAAWPTVDLDRQDSGIEAQFGLFQEALGAIREIRSRQNIPPKREVEFLVACNDATKELLQPLAAYFESLAGAKPTQWGRDVEPPATNAKVELSAATIFVDLSGLIDVEAEIARNRKELEKLEKAIIGKEKKLANENFLERAPAEVVAKERDGLAELRAKADSIRAALAGLQAA